MKKFGKNGELVFEDYKILGDGELSIKLTIRAKAFSEGAKEKIEKAGGKWIIIEDNNSKEKTEKIEEIRKERKTEKKPVVKKKSKINL